MEGCYKCRHRSGGKLCESFFLDFLCPRTVVPKKMRALLACSTSEQLQPDLCWLCGRLWEDSYRHGARTGQREEEELNPVTYRATTFSTLRCEEVTKILNSVGAGAQPSLLVCQLKTGDVSFNVLSECLTKQKSQGLMICESFRLTRLLTHTEANKISKINYLGTETVIVMKIKVFSFNSDFSLGESLVAMLSNSVI